ncbi:transcription antitermination factor NusB [Ferruginivarius sediminum]|uniref:Transcription antitermination protein NusB n=1 Tax=Ferruginivarius sediminum TaxID=2661937 RepID=A0A369THD0_9PROT|nr:transcription antitermination factor NusB [Ferruginivarius sediminum]RDD63785.1 transcription antitermination factor NusB [Ferruginivarius sediminum]
MTAAASPSPDAPKLDRRRQARLAAVQALYQVDLGKVSPQSVILEFLQHRLDEEIDGVRLGKIDRSLFGELVNGVSARREELEDMVAAVLDEDWPLDRLERLLRLILACGVYELAERPSVPARAVINEYVELARAFFDGKEPAMVNGVLDRLGHSLREEEFDSGQGEGL